MITLDKAKKALEASESKAKELGINVSTVIVDNQGSLIAASRMNEAIPISPKFALGKAYTAANLGLSTEDMAKFSMEGKPYFGLNTLFGGEFDLLAGGLPVKKDGAIIGGVGVGGSPDPSQDSECAKLAVALLEE